MGVRISCRETGDVTVVDLVGRVTLGDGSSSFRETIRELVAKGKKNIVLNLGEITYIYSSGVGELFSALRTVANNGGKMKLSNLTKRTHNLLSITKLINDFKVFDDEAAAVVSFS